MVVLLLLFLLSFLILWFWLGTLISHYLAVSFTPVASAQFLVCRLFPVEQNSVNKGCRSNAFGMCWVQLAVEPWCCTGWRTGWGNTMREHKSQHCWEGLGDLSVNLSVLISLAGVGWTLISHFVGRVYLLIAFLDPIVASCVWWMEPSGDLAFQVWWMSSWRRSRLAPCCQPEFVLPKWIPHYGISFGMLFVRNTVR